MTDLWDVATLTDFARDILAAVGCSSQEAELVASSLLHADVRGVSSHGLLRLPLYVEAVEAGGIVADAPMEWIVQRGAVGRLDAKSGFGQSAVDHATNYLVERLPEAGIATVAITNSTHYGAGSFWVDRIARQGFIAVLTANSGPCLAPFGSAEPLLGANPLSIALPNTGGHPVVLDMSSTEVAYGRIAMAHAEGQSIPDTWAIDRDGRATTDARAALKGALRPFGGHKGSGLGVVIELLSVALSGANFSRDVTDIFVDRSSQMGTGHLVVGLDPSAFGVEQEFAGQVAAFSERMRAARPAEGFDTVLMPGDREAQMEERHRQEGLQMSGAVESKLIALAERLGVTVPR